jgi:hypothetical protein
MIIIIDHYTNSEESIKTLIKSFNKQLELKSTISQKIKNTRGGEQLSWIKKYNGLFIHEWGFKEKKKK